MFDNAVDPYCVGATPPERVVLTPDPELDTPIAAAAWGTTYTATCIDVASLASFVARSIGHGPELICGSGYDPASVTAVCDGGDGG